MNIHFKYSELFVLLAASTMSFLANLPDNVLGGLVDRRALVASLVAVVVVAMFRYLQMMLLMTICILAIGANLPAELALQLGISQPALLVSLGILVAMTLVNRATRLLPMGTETAGELIIDTRRALLAAIEERDVAAVQRMLAKGLNVNFVQDGMIPLHLASEKGYTEIVELLISRGAVFQVKNANRESFALAGRAQRGRANDDMWRG